MVCDRARVRPRVCAAHDPIFRLDFSHCSGFGFSATRVSEIETRQGMTGRSRLRFRQDCYRPKCAHMSEVVVITGASADVGRAGARKFARHGARIGLLARGVEGIESCAQRSGKAGKRSARRSNRRCQRRSCDPILILAAYDLLSKRSLRLRILSSSWAQMGSLAPAPRSDAFIKPSMMAPNSR